MKAKLEKGFTIVELLIVIVVIAILAAITIVAFNGIQDRANETSIRNDISNFRKKIELFQVDNSAYPSSVADMEGMDIAAAKGAYTEGAGNLLYCVAADRSQYSIMAWTKSRKRFYVENGSVKVDSTNSTGGSSMCSPLVGASPVWRWGKSGGTWASWVK